VGRERRPGLVILRLRSERARTIRSRRLSEVIGSDLAGEGFCAPCAEWAESCRWAHVADEAGELAHGFNALGGPVRLRVFSMLAAAPSGEICVCDFIEPPGKSRGTTSDHESRFANS
jgi:DNA-binding transcriptional ArsR family regulator